MKAPRTMRSAEIPASDTAIFPSLGTVFFKKRYLFSFAMLSLPHFTPHKA